MTSVAIGWDTSANRGRGLLVGAWFGLAVLALLVTNAQGADKARASRLVSRARFEKPLIITQLPAENDGPRQDSAGAGPLRLFPADGARLVLVRPDSSTRVLSTKFHSACDPDVSFDGMRILFAGKKRAGDNWNIHEMAVDGSATRQITRNIGDCRGPGYQSTLYTIVSPEPWYQITFVGTGAGAMNEDGSSVATNLYSCKLDGTAVRRLTFNLSSDVDPFLMPSGRVLYAGRQRSTLDRGNAGRVALFGINIDGADHALFADTRGLPIKRMPCVTTGGLSVFVESDRARWDGAGGLSCVRMRRPLQSYGRLTGETQGLFHSPSPLPDGRILVSRRPSDSSGTHAVYRFDPTSGDLRPVFDDPRCHDVQAKVIDGRPVPDGRSSVVTEKDPHGRLYCLDVYNSDLRDHRRMPPGTVKKLRVLEGVPTSAEDESVYLPPVASLPSGRPGSTVDGLPPLAGRRILGEIDIEKDGSFNVEIPANLPIELQLLDAHGMAVRSCSWIWAKNHEPRGCIGCHEDGELTPVNLFKDSLARPSTPLDQLPVQRRSVDFRRDVMPIIDKKCAGCHGQDQAPPRLDGGLALVEHPGGQAYFNRAYESLLAVQDGSEESFRGKYVDPGRARTSPLVWHVLGRNMSRPWDRQSASRPFKPIPPGESQPLDEKEKLVFVQWVDMGASFNGVSRRFKKGSGTVARSTLRAVPATVPDPFLNRTDDFPKSLTEGQGQTR